MLIDTHTHLNFQAFATDWQQVVTAANQAGVAQMIVVGTDIKSSRQAVALATTHPTVYAAVGIHPHHAKKYLHKPAQMNLDLLQLESLVQNPKVVAIGEIGLDNHHYQKTTYAPIPAHKSAIVQAHQLQLFKQQLTLAHRHNLPLILHSREVGDQVLACLREFNQLNSPLRGVFHCFEGSKKYAVNILAAGLYLSFTGNITYIPDRQQVAATIPLDRLLLETDCPYMTPQPYRGQRNEPKHLTLIAACHARSRNQSVSTISRVTTDNARLLFNLPRQSK